MSGRASYIDTRRSATTHRHILPLHHAQKAHLCIVYPAKPALPLAVLSTLDYPEIFTFVLTGVSGAGNKI